MKENKLKWYIADKEYINYLKKFDDKVENINYKDRLKPYLGILININNMNYYVPISSAKEKHYKMNENIDFIKIMKQERLLGVLNLNNMVPIADEHIRILKYKEIDKYRKFKNNNERDLYISFINLELKLINDKIEKIKVSAIKLYTEKIARPSSKISRRCCDFKLLENKCKEYKKEKTYEKLDIYNENRIKTGKESNAFRDIYIINKEIPIETIKFNDGEVVDAKYVTIEELKQMIDSGEAFEWLRWFIEEFYKITKE